MRIKIISQAENKNNSRLTLEIFGTEFPGWSGIAKEIAEKYDCGFSKNTTVMPHDLDKDSNTYSKSFGTTSFNRGNHREALREFVKYLDLKK